MDLFKMIKEKGIFLKFRIGKKMFDPADQKRTTAYEDIKRKEKEEHGNKVQ